MMRNEKKGMTAGEIADKICEIAPEALQETWDNSGFLAGSRKQPVTKVLTCLDLDFSVLKENFSWIGIPKGRILSFGMPFLTIWLFKSASGVT